MTRARSTVTRPTCDPSCGEGNGHSARCRVAHHRLTRGRGSRAYVLTDEDRAAIERVCAADPLPDSYFR